MSPTDETLRTVRASLESRALPFPIRVKRIASHSLAFEVLQELADGSGTIACHQWGFETPSDLVTLESEALGRSLDSAIAHANRCEHMGIKLV